MTARRILDLVAEQGIVHQRLARGMRIGDAETLGVRIDVLHPPPGFVPGTVSTSNDNSIVLRMTMGTVSFLLTGDIEEAGLPVLLQQPRLASAVLKVPHHGSALGPSGAAFFQRVQPRVAVISVGDAHHLPSTETLTQLEASGAEILMTRRDGAVRIRTDGTRVIVTAQQPAP